MDNSLPESQSSPPITRSLAFWFCLLLAAALYAAVAPAPRVLTYVELREEFHSGQLELVELERRTVQLEQVIQALEHDPQYAAERARVDFQTAPDDEERIPVDPQFRLDGVHRTDAPPPRRSGRQGFLPWLQVLASHRTVRRAMLASAAMLVLFGFAGLRGVRPAGRPTPRLTHLAQWLSKRYRRQ